MGLDMYLTATRYLSQHDEKENLLSEQIQKLELGNMEFRIEEITCRVGYWRKANAIHKWFVDNVQDGKDDCGLYYVSKTDLQNLLDTCNEVIRNKKNLNLIMEKLPPQDGFFFGSTDIDEYYFEDIEETKKIIQKALELNHDWSIHYQSSW